MRRFATAPERPARAAALAAALAAPSLVAAQPAAPLTWAAPRGCPAADDVIARSREAGLDADRVPPWTARATVRRARGRWALDMEIRVGDDVVPQRREAATCRALAQLAGVDLALVLNAHIPPPPPPPPPPPVVQARPPPEPVRQVSVPEPVHERSRRWRVVVGALGGVELGVLPRAALAWGGRAGVAWDAVRVEARAVVTESLPETRVETVGGARTTFGATLRAVDLSLRGCLQTTLGRWTFAGCAGAAGGWVDAEGTGQLVQAESTRVPVVGAVLGGEALLHLTRWLAASVSADVGAFAGGTVLLYNSLPVNDPGHARGAFALSLLGVL